MKCDSIGCHAYKLIHAQYSCYLYLLTPPNNGTSWTEVDSGLNSSFVDKVFASGNTLFTNVRTWSTNGGGIYRSTNNGTSWTEVDSSLIYYITSLAMSDNIIFAGTYGGVFFSTNNGISWTPVNSGLMNMKVNSIVVSGSNIFAGTNGSGVWRRPLSEMNGLINYKPQREVIQQKSFKITALSHINQSIKIDFTLPYSDQVIVNVFNFSGREVVSPVNNKFSSGFHTLSWNTRNFATGCYTVRIQAGSNTFVKSIPIIR